MSCSAYGVRSWLRLLSLCCVMLLVARQSAAGAETAKGLVLTQDSQPAATIVLGAKPTASAQLAAFELQYHLRKISGATLPIIRVPQPVTGTAILVGESDAARALGFRNDDFPEQKYVIKTFPTVLLLMGRDAQNSSEVRYDDYQSVYAAATGPIGTCYAVHAFLETVLGVRWYYPNEELGTIIPTSATIVVKDLDVQRSPDAPVRAPYPFFSNTKSLYFTDWDQPKKFDSSMVDPRVSLLYWVRNRSWGDMQYNANHSFVGYDAAYGKSHPEWFSSKSYEKMQQMNYQMGIQPCLTAPGFFEEVVQVANDYFDGKSDAHPGLYGAAVGNYFPVMLNDNTNMCGCPECRAQYRNDVGPEGNASHYLWGFANRVAKEVRKSHPKAMITCCAYFNYTTPPKGLIFEPNVAVTFCKFYTYYADRNYQERDYQRISEYVHQNKAKFFTTWEYQLKPGMTEWAFPCLVPHVHAQDVQRLSKIGGFMGGTNQFLYMNTYSGENLGGVAWVSPVMDFMNIYWRLKLYDDFKFDIDKGLDEYYKTFFGPADEGMKKFYSAMERQWMEKGGGADSRSWWGNMGTPDFLKEVAGYIEQAKQATQEGSVYRKRVELIDAGIMQHMVKSRAKYERTAMSEFAPIGTAAVAHVGAAVTPENWANDATWAQSLPNEIEKTHLNEPAPQKSTVYLAYDNDHLYIKARCMEPHLAAIKAATRDKDIGGFSDDSIELFVDPSGRGETYYHFCINSLGAVYDALENPKAIGATATVSWDSGVKVKTASGQDYWEVRAALPFASLEQKTPKAGSTWRFNICRNRYSEPDQPPFSVWSPTLGGYQNPQRFGIITFNAPKDRGRVLWSCDLDSGAFTTASSESPLIGIDGWYETTSYANLGWDKSWKVIEQDGNRLAVCDVNSTNPSTIVPMHAVQAAPGVVSVEADFRRHALNGNAPQIIVADANGKYMGYFYTWDTKDDMVAIELPGNRQNFGSDAHKLGAFCAPGKWFGLKLVVNTTAKRVTGYLRSEHGDWVHLNKTPLPYHSPDAEGSKLFIGVGSRKYETVDNNVVEMDNIRVTQVSIAESPKSK